MLECRPANSRRKYCDLLSKIQKVLHRAARQSFSAVRYIVGATNMRNDGICDDHLADGFLPPVLSQLLRLSAFL